MKRLLGSLALIALAVSALSCNEPVGPVEKAPIIINDGPVDLSDQEFGMYYGDMGHNGIGIYSVVLSDAVCFRDGYGDPYLDSEGDMLVLEFNAPLQSADSPIMIPAGTYQVGEAIPGSTTINVAKSYIKRMTGNMQYHYDLVSGSVVVGRNDAGGYDMITENLVIARGTEQFSVQYSYNGNIMFDDWNKVAVSLQTIQDDIVDMPFTEVSAVYYGNLFGYGTGNYVVSLSTEGFIDDETGTLPGVMIVFNMFDELVAKDGVILMNEGTYTVYPSFNPDEFSMLYGMNMDGMPFGTYAYQIDAEGGQALEYIGEGTVEVTRTQESYDDMYTFAFELVTPSRKITGTWTGAVEFTDASEDSGRVILSTLDGDVECDMTKIEKGRLQHVETLRTTEQDPVDIAEAWQLWLEPVLIKGDNPQGNGDVMILEFVVPLGANGDIAPEINKEYTYQIQPNLSMEEELYNVSVSKMGRPYDDIFYQPNWDKYTYMTGWDARRGFTWDGGFRGNWYLHYLEGTYQNMDEMAPAVKGTVKVTRLTDFTVASGGGRQAEFKIVWDLYDDAEASYNITGEWTGPISTGNSIDNL